MTLTYDNGQQKTEESFTIIRAGANFTGVQTGEDFYNRFCNPNTTQAAATPTTKTPTNTTAPLPPPPPTIEGYPFPIVRDSGANVTSGYFLNGTGYDNVAVLSVLGFAPQGNIDSVEYLTNFQKTVASFLSQSKQAGTTRLVIDLSANGGGFVVARYELFAQVCRCQCCFEWDANADPDIALPRFSTLRGRQSSSGRQPCKIARITDSIPNNFTATTKADQNAITALQQSVITSNLVPGGVFSPEGAKFSTVDEILSPVSLCRSTRNA